MPTAPASARCFPDTPFTRTLRAMDDGVQASDEQLMLDWVAGDMASFEQLYGATVRACIVSSASMCATTALADEFFQDVWQKVIAARAGWVPDAPFGTWLYRIAHNRLGDHWRAPEVPGPAAPVDADERAARIPDPETPERHLSEFEQRARCSSRWTRCRRNNAK
jgi:RNA polymerase sigma-70 factor (ECF subfamily)